MDTDNGHPHGLNSPFINVLVNPIYYILYQAMYTYCKQKKHSHANGNEFILLSQCYFMYNYNLLIMTILLYYSVQLLYTSSL